MEMNENIIKSEAKKLLKTSLIKEEATVLSESLRISADADGGFIVTPTKLNPEKSEEGKQFTQRLQEKKPDLLVVIAYGKIIPQAILDIPKVAPINIHGSILPKYRGASPIQATLLNNDKET
jgi:methionyl-tRNA formyltransferase